MQLGEERKKSRHRTGPPRGVAAWLRDVNLCGGGGKRKKREEGKKGKEKATYLPSL